MKMIHQDFLGHSLLSAIWIKTALFIGGFCLLWLKEDTLTLKFISHHSVVIKALTVGHADILEQKFPNFSDCDPTQ